MCQKEPRGKIVNDKANGDRLGKYNVLFLMYTIQLVRRVLM